MDYCYLDFCSLDTCYLKRKSVPSFYGKINTKRSIHPIL